MKYLMCPQCGSPLFYVQGKNGYVFFHVDFDKSIVPTKPEFDEVLGMQLDEINCSSCSWKGPLRKLKKVFFG
ncbi:MAG: hypothetical protein ACOCW2_03405 [Chitinivibrionales bacterium]